jgi:hypothetical protein
VPDESVGRVGFDTTGGGRCQPFEGFGDPDEQRQKGLGFRERVWHGGRTPI